MFKVGAVPYAKIPTMEALLVILGAGLAFIGSAYLQALLQRRDGRAALYLTLLPEIVERIEHYLRVARQDPSTGPWWTLEDNDWPYKSEADAVYRQAVVIGRRESAKATELRTNWITFASQVHPDNGSPTDQILGNKELASVLETTKATAEDFNRWLQSTFFEPTRPR